MNKKQILDYFSNISIWKKGNQRAPHKPLLILLALGKLVNGNKRFIDFHDISSKLMELLRDFGPFRRSYKTIPPFWRLQKDNIWEVIADEKIVTNKSGDPNKTVLEELHAQGGFTKDVFQFLKTNPNYAMELAQNILEKHFSDTYHEDILQSVGLDKFVGTEIKIMKRKKRDPEFRNKILNAYGYRCAICGFDLRMCSTSICLEAAHIKWHQYGGPAEEQNGIALCSMHHKLFDRGAFGITPDLKIMVSDQVNGSSGLEEWLKRFSNHTLQLPTLNQYLPKQEFVSWHVREVFKGQGRDYF